MKLIQINPELQRNIWENITPTKLVVMPVLLGLIFMIAGSATNVGIMSLVFFYIITVMVGAYVAGEEIPNEIQDKTWDWQRMSTMTPMQMTIGKMFGSTIFQWYGGFICILGFLFSALTIKMNFINLIQFLICMVLVATFFQSYAMLLGIGTREMPLRFRRFLIIGVLLGLAILLVSVFTIIGVFSYFEKRIDKNLDIPTVTWFFIKLPILTHFLFALVFLNFWSFAGLYRSFRTEMYYFNGPEFFIIFLIALPFYFSGYLFNFPEINTSAYLTLLFAGIAVFAYQAAILTALIDKMEIITFRRLFYHLELKNYKKVGYDTPLWLIALVIEIVASLFALLIFTVSSRELSKLEPDFPQKILYFLLVINLFAIRDIGIFMFNNFTQGKNAIGLTLTYLFVLYYILPALIATTGNEQLLPAFYPIPYDKNFELSATNILIPLVQALIVVLIIRNVWITKNEKVQQSIQS